jgi:hypothetical protein
VIKCKVGNGGNVNINRFDMDSFCRWIVVG